MHDNATKGSFETARFDHFRYVDMCKFSKRTFLFLVLGFLTGLVFGSLLYMNKSIIHNVKKCHIGPSMRNAERRPQNIIQELGETWLVFIGVLTDAETIESPARKLLYKDWASSLPGKIVFFITKTRNSSTLNKSVVYLQGSNLTEPPMKYLIMLRYISKYYLTWFKWFMLAEDDLFVNTDKLYFLRRLNYLEDYVLTPESDKHETYLSTSGTIISRSFLRKISRNIIHCPQNLSEIVQEDDINSCFENTLTLLWSQGSKAFNTTDNSEHFNSICSETNDRFVTKMVTADLSLDIYCLYRLQIRVLSHKLRIIDRNYIKLRYKLNNLQMLIRTNIYERRIKVKNIDSPRNIKQYGRIFNMRKMFGQERKLSWTIRGREKEGISWIVENVMDKLREVYNSNRTNVKFHSLYYGYMSINPVKEIEYNLNINTDILERHMIKTRQVFGQLHARTINIDSGEEILINIVVPLTGRLEIYTQFLESLEKNILKKNDRVSLLIVYFPEKNPPGEHINIIQNYRKRYPKIEFNWLNLTGAFARARALQAGIHFYKDNSLMFFADIDLMFTSEFLQRCKSHCISGKRLYFPVMFKLFNPKIGNIKFNFTNYFKNFEHRIGEWRIYSFGPVCAYRNDVTTVGGFNIGITQWGFEDVQFFERFLSNTNYEVIRTIDPGLFHLYHAHAKCDVITNSLQRRMCENAMLEGLASQDTVLKYLLEKRYLTL